MNREQLGKIAVVGLGVWVLWKLTTPPPQSPSSSMGQAGGAGPGQQGAGGPGPGATIGL